MDLAEQIINLMKIKGIVKMTSKNVYFKLIKFSKNFTIKKTIVYFILLYFFILSINLYAASSLDSPINLRVNSFYETILANNEDVVNAVNFGYNMNDSTSALQSAIDSNAKTVFIPNVGADWIVRPINLASNQKIIFEPGVNVIAKKGAFKGIYDCLFFGDGLHDVTIEGNGAHFIMNQDDYISATYEKSEYRHVLSVRGGTNIKISGMNLSDSGGDGIYIGRSITNGLHSKNIEIRDCVCDNNYRQGISITNAENIILENCIVKNTSGTFPKAGLMFEPNTGDILRNCKVINCIAENNVGAGFRVQLEKLSESESVYILFENCIVKSGGIGLQVGSIKDGNLTGMIEFKNCTVENTSYPGIYIHDKFTNGANVKFENCSVKNTGNGSWYPKTALLLSKNDSTPTTIFGGIEFLNCTIYEEPYRLPLLIEPTVGKSELEFISGTLQVYDPKNEKFNMGSSIENTSINIEYFSK